MKSLKTDSDDFRESQRKAFSPLNIAAPWRRVSAQLIDLALVAFCCTCAMVFWFSSRLFTGHWWMALIALTIYVSLLTQIIFLSIYGNTLGKKVMNLKIQSARPKQGVTTLQVIQRCFAWWIGAFSFGNTWTTIFTLSDRRAWHDVIAETVVVNDEANQKSSHPSSQQKAASNFWVTATFVGFILILMLTLLHQFRALRSGQLTISDDTQKTSRERSSWYLLAGLNSMPGSSSSSPNEGHLNADSANKEEEILGDLIDSFARARDLSPANRLAYYKSNMEAKENFLCRAGHESSGFCQSAQALNQLLNASIIKKLHPLALEGLRILEKVEAQNRLSDQLQVIDVEALHWDPNTFEYGILGEAKANILMKAGHFDEAHKTLALVAQTAPTVLKASVEENFCQTAAVTDCSFKNDTSCLANRYWKAWADGCGSAAEPRDGGLSSEVLGYWWGQAHRNSHFDNLASWEKVKDHYGASFQEAPFEKYVVSALDFVLNMRSANPSDLVGKSKSLSLENPLWGWAQSEALKEFGEQWTFLVHPSEKNLISRYGLLEKNNQMMIASRKNSGSTTEASTSDDAPPKKKAPGTFGAFSGPAEADSPHSGGVRTQDSR